MYELLIHQTKLISDILGKANQRLPDTKILWGAIAVIAVVVMLNTATSGISILAASLLFIFAPAIILIMIVGLVPKPPPEENSAVARVTSGILYGYTALIVGIAFLTASSTFFKWPVTAEELWTSFRSQAIDRKTEVTLPPADLGVPKSSPLTAPPTLQSGGVETAPGGLKECLSELQAKSNQTFEVSLALLAAQARDCQKKFGAL